MPRRFPPGSAEDWLARARSNLAKARQPKPADVFWEDQCFETHQSIEKALKAVYLKRGLLFKFVHDIDELARGLEQDGVRIPPAVRQSIGLTRYAFEARYPGPYEPATEKEFKEALALAEAVVAWAEKIIRTPDKPGESFVREPQAVYRPPEAASRRRRLPAQIYKKNPCRVGKPKKKRRKRKR